MTLDIAVVALILTAVGVSIAGIGIIVLPPLIRAINRQS